MYSKQLTILTVAYTSGLQYWAEKLKPPRSLDLCLLAGCVVELRETAQEHVTFNHWDVVQGLGAIHLGGPKPPCLATYCHHLLRDRILQKPPPTPLLLLLMKTTTRCTTLPSGTEKENPYLLVVTASVGQLNLGPRGWWSKKIQSWYTRWKHILESMDGCCLPWVYQGNQLCRHHCKGVGWVKDVWGVARYLPLGSRVIQLQLLNGQTKGRLPMGR